MRRSVKKKLRRHRSIPEVSLTPLIDTALTLLIIFMVTTPMIHNNIIKVDLPKGGKQEKKKNVQQALVVSVNESGDIFFNSEKTALKDIGDVIKNHIAQSGNSEEQRVWVKIDKKNSCDMLVGLIDKIKFIGGVKDVAVATAKAA